MRVCRALQMGATTVRSSSVMSGLGNHGGGSPVRRGKMGVPDEMALEQLRNACWHISERIQGLEQRAEAVAAAEPASMPPWSEKSAESIAARALVRNWKDDESNPLAVCLKRIDVILGACSTLAPQQHPFIRHLHGWLGGMLVERQRLCRVKECSGRHHVACRARLLVYRRAWRRFVCYSGGHTHAVGQLVLARALG
jgi:hypothetical protein